MSGIDGGRPTILFDESDTIFGPKAGDNERKTRAEVTAAVRELEQQRDAKSIRKAGRPWTVRTWLTHWIETSPRSP